MTSFHHQPNPHAMNHTSSTAPQRQQDEIRMLAHHLWQQAGCPANQDFHFWLQAERQLFGDRREQSKPVAASNGRKPPKASPKAEGTTRGGAKHVTEFSANGRRKSQSGTVRAAARAQ